MPPSTSDTDSTDHSDSTSDTDSDSDSGPTAPETAVQAKTHVPRTSVRAAFVIPPLLWAISVASIAAIWKCLPPDTMDTPGFCPAALAIPYALLPIYIACHWVPAAFRRFWPAPVASKLVCIATVVAVALALVVHALVLAALASFRLKAPAAASLMVLVFGLTALSDTLLFMACAWRARASSTAARILSTILVAILVIFCIGCYAVNLKAVFDNDEHGIFILPPPASAAMPS
jgi:hypothetical protein